MVRHGRAPGVPRVPRHLALCDSINALGGGSRREDGHHQRVRAVRFALGVYTAVPHGSRLCRAWLAVTKTTCGRSHANTSTSAMGSAPLARHASISICSAMARSPRPICARSEARMTPRRPRVLCRKPPLFLLIIANPFERCSMT